MRPKTFPAAPYVGNTRQRLQEIKEGLKQPAKLVSQALHGGSSRNDSGRGADCKSGKDTASRQQQLRPPQKFNNYQNALREIRKSLMPFANESGPSSGSGHSAGAGEVNRQMLQELVNAGCDQVSQRERMAWRSLEWCNVSYRFQEGTMALVMVKNKQINVNEQFHTFITAAT